MIYLLWNPIVQTGRYYTFFCVHASLHCCGNQALSTRCLLPTYAHAHLSRVRMGYTGIACDGNMGLTCRPYVCTGFEWTCMERMQSFSDDIVFGSRRVTSRRTPTNELLWWNRELLFWRRCTSNVRHLRLVATASDDSRNDDKQRSSCRRTKQREAFLVIARVIPYRIIHSFRPFL